MAHPFIKIYIVTYLALLAGCATPAYKYIYEIMPEKNQLCRYKKISDLQKKKISCHSLDEKNPDGYYKFSETLVITKRALRELLRKQLDAVFGK